MKGGFDIVCFEQSLQTNNSESVRKEMEGARKNLKGSGQNVKALAN